MFTFFLSCRSRIFLKRLLEVGQPSEKLIITANHALIWKEKRRPAYCFQNCQGVTYHQKVPQSQILQADVDAESSTVYDLQFDHDGTYVANNVIIQSRSPYSQLTPLPQELYFDPTLYSDEKVGDSYDQILPLEISIL